LQIVVDHDPRRLRIHLDFAFGAQCEWLYLEQGPDAGASACGMSGPAREQD
jgi:uncharacterized protein (DUF2249 family)